MFTFDNLCLSIIDVKPVFDICLHLLTSPVHQLSWITMARDPEKRLIGVWVKESLKNQITEQAKSENRNLSNYIETLLIEHLMKLKHEGRTKTVQPPEIM